MTKRKEEQEKHQFGQSPKIACPHCRGHVYVRTGVQINRTNREVTYLCKDAECGFSFVALLSVVRWLSPSGKPNPRVNLPGPNAGPHKIPPEPYVDGPTSNPSLASAKSTDPPSLDLPWG